jgi:hypothetical protein
MPSIEPIKRAFVMSRNLRMATAAIMLGFTSTGAVQARGGHGIGGRHLLVGPPPVAVPQQPVMPQFNNPGPQISVPQPGNALNQLSPLPFGVDRPDALGIK